ncbi:hypothetical protein VTK56DRAFT_6477 [Thermocarpiscus australiensis]
MRFSNAAIFHLLLFGASSSAHLLPRSNNDQGSRLDERGITSQDQTNTGRSADIASAVPYAAATGDDALNVDLPDSGSDAVAAAADGDTDGSQEQSSVSRVKRQPQGKGKGKGKARYRAYVLAPETSSHQLAKSFASLALHLFALSTNANIRWSAHITNLLTVWCANFTAGSPDTDDHGHGVAKNAVVVAVKVPDRDGAGSMSGLPAGPELGRDRRTEPRRRPQGRHQHVSGRRLHGVGQRGRPGRHGRRHHRRRLGGKNSDDDAADYSPASAPTAARGSPTGPAWSNVFAPGVGILSAS